MPLPSLDEIKDRKLVQWGLAYLAGAWLVLQVVALLGATYDWPKGLLRAVPIVLAGGFLVALVVAWYHGEKGEQKVSGTEASILAALLGLAGLGVMLVGGGGEAERVTVAEATEEADRTWLAVLPFEAIGADSTHFAEGMTAELTETLGQIPGLRVVAQTSASAFQDANVPTDSIGRALGVGFLVEGTVRPLGDSIRVTARLVEASSGATEWSETFERGVDDVFAVQQDIAFNVADRLGSRVGAVAFTSQGTDDPDAYRLILQARHLSGDGETTDHWEAARLAREAIERDSTYSAAWTSLCYAHRQLAGNGLTDDPDAERATARTACQRAIALDPNNASAHMWLGSLLHVAGDTLAAQTHYERSLAANPSYVLPLISLARLRLAEGDEQEAIRLVERAVRIDPLSWNVLHYGAGVLAQARRPARAVELQRRVMFRFPEHPIAPSRFGLWLAEAGQTDEAVVQTRQAFQRVARDTAQWQGELQEIYQNAAYVFALAGDRAEAERFLGELTADSLYYRAAVETALGNFDAAFPALEQSIEAGEYTGTPENLLSDPWLDPLHEDPRWERLLSRVRVSPPRTGG